MKSIWPATFSTGDLTSDVPITETAWTAGTYATGVQRYVGIDLYEVTATPNTTDEPTAGAALPTPTWVKIGQINRWRMFNGALYQQTEQAGGPLTVSIDYTGIVNAIAVLNVVATEADVTMTDSVDGVVYNRVVSLIGYDMIVDWYAWFFGAVSEYTEFVLTDLPTYLNANITLTLSAGATGDVSCGGFVIGEQKDLGETLSNFSVRNRYFSRRERSVWGDFLDVLSRPMAREATFSVLLNSSAVSSVLNIIGDRRDVPTVYIGGEDFRHSIVYGFPDEPEASHLTNDYSMINLTILGQT